MFSKIKSLFSKKQLPELEEPPDHEYDFMAMFSDTDTCPPVDHEARAYYRALGLVQYISGVGLITVKSKIPLSEESEKIVFATIAMETANDNPYIAQKIYDFIVKSHTKEAHGGMQIYTIQGRTAYQVLDGFVDKREKNGPFAAPPKPYSDIIRKILLSCYEPLSSLGSPTKQLTQKQVEEVCEQAPPGRGKNFLECMLHALVPIVPVLNSKIHISGNLRLDMKIVKGEKITAATMMPQQAARSTVLAIYTGCLSELEI